MEFKNQRFSRNSYTMISEKNLEIPVLCPNCGVSNNPSTSLIGTSDKYGFFSHTCTACSKRHYSIQEYDGGFGKCKTLYPLQQPSNLPEHIVKFSERFVKMFRDAELAESNNSIDLAGMGYRASLEILLKDYALNFNLDSREEIAKINLNNAISKYFKTDVDTQTAADVVRILGNDYAHWDQNEELDIEILKAYLNIFVQIINTKLMLKYPPVSRHKKDN